MAGIERIRETNPPELIERELQRMEAEIKKQS
jgi:hypothetical protein